jgi:hypothetical protein
MKVIIDRNFDPQTFPYFISLSFINSPYFINAEDLNHAIDHIEHFYTQYINKQMSVYSDLLKFISSENIPQSMIKQNTDLYTSFLKLYFHDVSKPIRTFYLKPLLYHQYITEILSSIKTLDNSEKINELFHQSHSNLIEFTNDHCQSFNGSFTSNLQALQYVKKFGLKTK